MEQNQRELWTDVNYLLKPRDILIMPNDTRLRIVSVVIDEPRGTPCKQVMRCIEINPNDVEYDIRLPEAIAMEIRNQPKRANLNLG